ncbi:tRNA methyltransferase [Helicobacter cynogastricus]|uniref:tRNA methyltransferase n=1 Tax=Helicobacter cynogastricus TaxID=329937 RepID=UPI000CF0C777|nr:tRNA methyltransferase [Helicobacter cynogastricus]
MIRLLLLALLLLNLQGKEPPNHKDTQFFKAFKALHDYMRKSFIAIYDDLKNPPDNPVLLTDLTQTIGDYTDASIPLAKAVAKQVPLFQEFKPKNKREELFLAHVKDMAMLHVLDILDIFSANIVLEAKLDDVMDIEDASLTEDPSTFLNATAWLYAPLFNAHKLGLDVIAYLEQLHRIFSKKQVSFGNIIDFNRARLQDLMKRLQDLMKKNFKNIVPYKPFRERLAEDMRNACCRTNNIFKELFEGTSGHYRYWVSIVLNTILDLGQTPSIMASLFGQEAIHKNIQRIDPEHLSDLYTARVIPLERNAPFYDSLRNDNPKILKDTLKDHPTMCLSPKYLSPKSQQTCLQLFQEQTYNTKDIQEQLHLVRLISIDNAPCVYLDPKDKLQAFKSDNVLCLALQKHLNKEF